MQAEVGKRHGFGAVRCRLPHHRRWCVRPHHTTKNDGSVPARAPADCRPKNSSGGWYNDTGAVAVIAIACCKSTHTGLINPDFHTACTAAVPPTAIYFTFRTTRYGFTTRPRTTLCAGPGVGCETTIWFALWRATVVGFTSSI